MVATSSTMLPLGTQAPDFSLFDPRRQKQVRLSENSDKEGYLVAFICNHCPYVIHLLDHLTAKFQPLVRGKYSMLCHLFQRCGKLPCGQS